MFKDFFVFPEYDYDKEFLKSFLVSQLVRDMSKRTYLTNEDKNVLKLYLTRSDFLDAKYVGFKEVLLARKIFPMSKLYRTEESLLQTLWSVVDTAAFSKVDPVKIYVDVTGSFPDEKQKSLENLRVICEYIDYMHSQNKEIDLEEIRGLIG